MPSLKPKEHKSVTKSDISWAPRKPCEVVPTCSMPIFQMRSPECGPHVSEVTQPAREAPSLKSGRLFVPGIRTFGPSPLPPGLCFMGTWKHEGPNAESPGVKHACLMLWNLARGVFVGPLLFLGECCRPSAVMPCPPPLSGESLQCVSLGALSWPSCPNPEWGSNLPASS